MSRHDVKLPKTMEKSEEVVKEEVTLPKVAETTQDTEVKEETTESAPGSKTDPALLLESLQQEREKVKRIEEEKRLAEEELELLKSSTASDDVFSEEGKALKGEISRLEKKLADIETKEQLSSIYSKNPELSEVKDEFEEFRQSKKNYSLEDTVELFKAKKGMIETPKRKGLEKPTGGDRTPQPQGMTKEDVENLRVNNNRKYMEMLLKGAFDDII